MSDKKREKGKKCKRRENDTEDQSELGIRKWRERMWEGREW